jgi:hypothetical protein
MVSAEIYARATKQITEQEKERRCVV